MLEYPWLPLISLTAQIYSTKLLVAITVILVECSDWMDLSGDDVHLYMVTLIPSA